jgi:hypothetical protein
MNRLITSILLTVFACFGELTAQTEFLRVKLSDGNTQDFALSELRKMDFDGDHYRFHQWDGSLTSFDFNAVEFYTYFNTQTSIADMNTQSTFAKLNVYPNPSQGMLNVDFIAPGNGPMMISLYAINGQLIYQQSINAAKEGNVIFDVSVYPSGTYFLVMKGNGFSISKNILKN